MLKHIWPSFRRDVWILAAGRLLSQIGTGFTLFYAPIFFVNQVGLSATLVGLALGLQQISGVIGRFLGGTLADTQTWGRRRTLLLSAAISAIADVALAGTANFSMLVVGNLLMGMGIGLYWPATEAAVADLTTDRDRNEAFAVTRLADSLGLGMGTILGGVLIASGESYRWLFIIDGISFVVFFGVIYFAIAETYQFQPGARRPSLRQGWLTALSDRHLLVYLVANIMFTSYVSQIQSTLPLYLSNFAIAGERTLGLAPKTISILFAFHTAFAALVQLPVARSLNRLRRPQALIGSMSAWAIGFILVWSAGVYPDFTVVIAALAVATFALGLVAYNPAAASLISEIAPDSLRGTYMAVNAQCWAIGFFIGPPLGGWAMDRSVAIRDGFWLFAAATTLVGIAILRVLDRLLKTRGDLLENSN